MVEVLNASQATPHNPTLEQELASRDATDAAKTAAAGKILGKFTDHAALETGYANLEASNSRMAQELADLKRGAVADPAKVAADAAAAAAADPAKVAADKVIADAAAAAATADQSQVEADARQIVTDAGVDFNALRTSYDTNGTLSEADYAALEKGGIPRAFVEDFVAGQEARRDLEQAHVNALEAKAHGVAGDSATYTAMTDWARSNLTQSEINLYNAEIDSNNEARVINAVTNLKARHSLAEGAEPTLRLGGTPPAADGAVFENMFQVQEVMRTKEYKTDEGFRNRTIAKMQRSPNLK